MQLKKRTEDWNYLPQITAQYFCEHIDEILDRIEQEGISFLIADEDSGNEVIVCQVDGIHQQKYAIFAEQMEQHIKCQSK